MDPQHAPGNPLSSDVADEPTRAPAFSPAGSPDAGARELLRIHQVLQANERQFREMIDALPVAIYTTDGEGRLTHFNPAAVQFSGRVPEIGTNKWCVSWKMYRTDGTPLPHDECPMAVALKEGRMMHGAEAICERPDGTRVWFQAYPTALRDSEGKVVSGINMLVDVTDRKRNEAILREAEGRRRRELEDALHTEQAIAERLQRSLLPKTLPALLGVAIRADYRVSNKALQVGGDWYDAFELPSGHIALLIGDVVGRGLEAAVTMGQLRHTLAAYLSAGDPPGTALERLDHFAQNVTRGMMATVLCGVFDPAARLLRLASAGHPHPLMITGDGTAEFISVARSLPVGVAPGTYTETTLEVEPGATIVFYTDGLIERRSVPLDTMMQRLREQAADAIADADTLPGGIIDRMAAGQLLHDDVAVLTLRVESLRGQPLRLRLPAQPESLATLRQGLRRWLHEAGAEPREIAEVVVAVGEAAGNAIEHAYLSGDEDFTVEAEVREGTVDIVVRDFGGWRDREEREATRGRGTRVMQGLMAEVDVRRSPDGTTVYLRRPLQLQAR